MLNRNALSKARPSLRTGVSIKICPGTYAANSTDDPKRPEGYSVSCEPGIIERLKTDAFAGMGLIRKLNQVPAGVFGAAP